MGIERLTPTQLRVARAVAEQKTLSETAAVLGVTSTTARNLVDDLGRVLGVSSQQSLRNHLRRALDSLSTPDSRPAPLHIYIASPYTLGDTATNVRRQIDAANQLIDAGYVPVWPLSCHYLHEVVERDYETWMVMCFAWLSRCDGVLRLTGESSGADREVQEAYRLGIPVLFEEHGQKWEKKPL